MHTAHRFLIVALTALSAACGSRSGGDGVTARPDEEAPALAFSPVGAYAGAVASDAARRLRSASGLQLSVDHEAPATIELVSDLGEDWRVADDVIEINLNASARLDNALLSAWWHWFGAENRSQSEVITAADLEALCAAVPCLTFAPEVDKEVTDTPSDAGPPAADAGAPELIRMECSFAEKPSPKSFKPQIQKDCVRVD